MVGVIGWGCSSWTSPTTAAARPPLSPPPPWRLPRPRHRSQVSRCLQQRDVLLRYMSKQYPAGVCIRKDALVWSLPFHRELERGKGSKRDRIRQI